ncbi:MAG: peptidoglycan-binding protein [Bacteroidetes bacterium]|jgi:hypothetical protein|nr:peptidoglycan-binding protein [Bacteroidota bacterium]
MLLKKTIPFLFAIAAANASYAQTTISNSSTPNLSNEPVRKTTAHKLLIVPFEPRMYMSQIDHKINEETKWNQKKIKENFRFGLDEELYKSIKKKMEVMSFLDDTTKYKKDLVTTYEKLSYRFDKIPDQAKYAAPKKEKDQNYVQKGQLVAVTETDGKFMNAEIKDKSLLTGFNSKYKTDIFLFINQFDITTEMPASDLTTKSTRTLTVHYTVLTKDGKEINSGISKTTFPSDINTPSKIADKYFSKIADEIAARIVKAMNAQAAAK